MRVNGQAQGGRVRGGIVGGNRRRAPARPASWYEIRNATARRADSGPSYAEVYLYDEIGLWGVTAGMFVDELRSLDVDELDLHINSPGGDLFDGIAIYEALQSHPAAVCVYVDSLAASIASVIAMAGDHVVMGRMAQLMIHDAWGGCIGNAADMRQMADELDRFSNTIASAYREKSQAGTVGQWRKAMLAETWYDANEAVAAGLADEVASRPASDADADVAARLERSWNLGDYGYRYEGREAAPSPSGAQPGTAAPAATADPDPDPPAEPDRGDVEHVPPIPDDLDIAALFTGALTDAASPPAIPMPGADIAALIAHEVNHRPADPAPEVRAPVPSTIDPAAFATALKEGLQA